jgi:GT2 family glycosyltransferase
LKRLSFADREEQAVTLEVSVVVPTYRRQDLLASCLDALLAQNLDPDRYEIIVADDEASPRTQELVERLSRRGGPALRYVAVTSTQGPAGARNAGWQAANAAVIAFTDDDCQPQPDWLREGLAAMTPTVDAVAGGLEVPLPPEPTDYERDTAGLAKGEFVTANCFVRRAALEAVGGFDERFTMAWREDSDLQFSLLEHGFCIERAPQALVVHPVRPAPWGISLRQQRKGLFNSLLFRKHPRLYRQRIPRFPVSYYAMAALLATSAALAIAREPQWAALAAVLWSLLLVRFCARRLRGTSKAPAHVAEMVVTSALIPLAACYWLIRGNIRFRVLRLS